VPASWRPSGGGPTADGARAITSDALPALAARAQLGDRAALETLLRGLQDPLREHIRALVRDDDLADDALQESLLLVCRKLRGLREPRWVRAWAYRVATREAVRTARQAARRRGEPLVNLTEADEIAEVAPVPDADELAALMRGVEALSTTLRVVIRMHYLREMSQQEIAAALEIPVGTVKSRLAAGLARLRATTP
jgi:RNA polymerase sigma-70 factor (ECF subfamily)